MTRSCAALHWRVRAVLAMAACAVIAIPASPAAAVTPSISVQLSTRATRVGSIVDVHYHADVSGTRGIGTVVIERAPLRAGRAGRYTLVATGSRHATSAIRQGTFHIRLSQRGRYLIRARVLVYAAGAPHPKRRASPHRRVAVGSRPRQVLVVGSRVVALTFDDGPSLRTTPLVLEALRAHDARATFFLTGRLAQAYPSLARREIASGHTVACHGLTHSLLVNLSASRLWQEVYGGRMAVERIVGRRVRWLRPAYGATSERVRHAIEDAGMRQVRYSVDPQDWRTRDRDDIVRKVVGGAHDGAIILLHDSGAQRSSTGAAVPIILDALERRDVDLVTLDEMAALGYPIR